MICRKEVSKAIIWPTDLQSPCQGGKNSSNLGTTVAARVKQVAKASRCRYGQVDLRGRPLPFGKKHRPWGLFIGPCFLNHVFSKKGLSLQSLSLLRMFRNPLWMEVLNVYRHLFIQYAITTSDCICYTILLTHYNLGFPYSWDNTCVPSVWNEKQMRITIQRVKWRNKWAFSPWVRTKFPFPFSKSYEDARVLQPLFTLKQNGHLKWWVE